jgi:predicted nuclease of predicted toxin-antitoxin system
MKIIIDMNLTPRWVQLLSGEGRDVRHWSFVGDPKAPDPIIMQWAREYGFIVLTNDLDFPQILAYTQAGPPEHHPPSR